MHKITIIGAGNVGATIAFTLMTQGIASEIVLIDINRKKAEGEAIDIRQGVSLSVAPCALYSGDYPDAVGSDIVILTSGMARKPGQTRLDLAQVNIDITKTIIPQIVRYAPGAKYIIVSNPVDILTYLFNKVGGIPEAHIIGTGTILDTTRLRSKIAEVYNVSHHNVHAHVFGEHGDSSLVVWSQANISYVPLLSYYKAVEHCTSSYQPIDTEALTDYVHKSGAEIIARKGATFYAISISVAHICKAILNGIDTTMTVSTLMHGEYGIDDVCLSVLNLVGRDGVRGKVMVDLNDDEIAKLQHSAQILKDLQKGLKF